MADKAKRPPPAARSETEYSSTAESEPDQGYESRSRSQSRRRRRQNQRQRQSAQASARSGDAQAKSLSTVQEQPEQANDGLTQHERDLQTMQPFEWIGKDDTSMNGPVTYARAQRGEIPARPGNPNQQLATGPGGASGGKSMDEQDGLKLKLELNLDVEVELKARIRGDLTIALLT